MNILPFLFFFSASTFAGAPHLVAINPFPHLTAQQFAQQIHDQGAKVVIASIPDADGGEWNYIMEHIASGSPDWLSIVPLISTAGAEGWNEDISSALAMAIPKNAPGVMAVIDDAVVPLSTDVVCSMPLYQGSTTELNQYVVDAIRALHKTTTGKNCLDKLVNVVGQSTEFSEDL
ncbi:hypothetical protein [Rouxiella sp. Mn2063]|uniref:hypothetical protein n=1 Tax=Rouxiella sp. Mn2063 TaxID=3395262 RepID=UPI003BC3FA21